MNRKIIIIGASGHGHVIADIIYACGDEVVGYLDDDSKKNVLGSTDEYYNFSDFEFIIGIGDTAVKEKFSLLPVRWYTAIHPTAVISPSATIGEGSVVMPNAVVNAGAVIGRHCIVNTAAVVEHDCKVDDYAHISVGSRLGGTVTIGKSTWIGIGASVRNNISICEGCTIGAGAVVVKDIIENGTYIGIPARKG